MQKLRQRFENIGWKYGKICVYINVCVYEYFDSISVCQLNIFGGSNQVFFFYYCQYSGFVVHSGSSSYFQNTDPSACITVCIDFTDRF